jgi:hypothetical protein
VAKRLAAQGGRYQEDGIGGIARSAPPPPAAREVESDLARLAASDIYADCLDRRGIKWEFEKVDEDVRREIIAAWADIIRPALRPASPSTGEEGLVAIMRQQRAILVEIGASKQAIEIADRVIAELSK